MLDSQQNGPSFGPETGVVAGGNRARNFGCNLGFLLVPQLFQGGGAGSRYVVRVGQPHTTHTSRLSTRVVAPGCPPPEHGRGGGAGAPAVVDLCIRYLSTTVIPRPHTLVMQGKRCIVVSFGRTKGQHMTVSKG